MALKSVMKSISSSCGDRDHRRPCAGRRQVFWNIWWVCDDRKPSRHLRGSSLKQGKGPSPTYVVICSLWDMAQQGWMEEVWIQSCPEFLCWESHPEIRSQKKRRMCILVFFFFLFTSVTFGKLPLLTESQDLCQPEIHSTQYKHWHVQFFKLRWNSHNIQLTF